VSWKQAKGSILSTSKTITSTLLQFNWANSTVGISCISTWPSARFMLDLWSAFCSSHISLITTAANSHCWSPYLYAWSAIFWYRRVLTLWSPLSASFSAAEGPILPLIPRYASSMKLPIITNAKSIQFWSNFHSRSAQF
jgi:hypothetical protein